MQLILEWYKVMQHNSFPNLVPNPHFVSILEIKGLKIRTLYEKKKISEVSLHMK